jgi:hypothetical protein
MGQCGPGSWEYFHSAGLPGCGYFRASQVFGRERQRALL